MKRLYSDIKADARGNLLGKYPTLIGATLILAFVEFIVSGIFSSLLMVNPGPLQYVIYYVASTLISMLVVFFGAGIYCMHLKAARHQPVEFSDFTFAMKNNPNRFLIAGLILTVLSYLYEIPVSILFEYLAEYLLYGIQAMGISLSIPAELPNISSVQIACLATVIGGLLYLWLALKFILVLYLLIDHPEMSAVEAFACSNKYMKGNKLRLFGLYLSFLGLWIAGIFTMGLGFLWILPYMLQTVTVFYLDLTQ